MVTQFFCFKSKFLWRILEFSIECWHSQTLPALIRIMWLTPWFLYSVPVESDFLHLEGSNGQRRKWQPTPVLLPGSSHGRRSLVGCSPWGRWGSDTTEQLPLHFSLSCIGEGNGNPLQRSCLENPRDGGACWAAIYGVAQSWTRLKQLSSSSSSGNHWYHQCLQFFCIWSQRNMHCPQAPQKFWCKQSHVYTLRVMLIPLRWACFVLHSA